MLYRLYVFFKALQIWCTAISVIIFIQHKSHYYSILSSYYGTTSLDVCFSKTEVICKAPFHERLKTSLFTQTIVSLVICRQVFLFSVNRKQFHDITNPIIINFVGHDRSDIGLTRWMTRYIRIEKVFSFIISSIEVIL